MIASGQQSRCSGKVNYYIFRSKEQVLLYFHVFQEFKIFGVSHLINSKMFQEFTSNGWLG